MFSDWNPILMEDATTNFSGNKTFYFMPIDTYAKMIQDHNSNQNV